MQVALGANADANKHGPQSERNPMKTAAHISLFRAVLAIAVMASCHVLQAASLARLRYLGSRRRLPKGCRKRLMKQVAELDKYDPWDPRRADILERLAQQSRSAKDRNMWYQQMADTLSGAVQAGDAPNGVKRLRMLCQQLQKDKADKALLAYVKFRAISADHSQKLQSPNADIAKVQEEFNREPGAIRF